MAATKRFGHLNGRLLPVVVGLAAIATAGVVAALPQATLDLLMWRLWLPHILSAATPPIGVSGRIVFALASGFLVAAIGLAPVLTMLRTRGRMIAEDDMPVLRRADAHPDAPPRRPIRASADLGEPLPIAAAPRTMPVPEPEQPLPADLDQPLAAFDPTAVPAAPREPIRPVAPLAPRPALIDPGERFETFALTPIVRAVPSETPTEVELTAKPTAAPPPVFPASIGSLLDRLERASPNRAAAPAPGTLDETLGMLRRLAAG